MQDIQAKTANRDFLPRLSRPPRPGAGTVKAQDCRECDDEVGGAQLNLEICECVEHRRHPSLDISWARSILVASDQRDGNLPRVHPAPNSPHTCSLRTSCAPEMPGRQSADPANQVWTGPGHYMEPESLLET